MSSFKKLNWIEFVYFSYKVKQFVLQYRLLYIFGTFTIKRADKKLSSDSFESVEKGKPGKLIFL